MAKQDRSGSTPITDPRFANLSHDARFRLPSKKHAKVQLDSRFSGLLKDEEFSKKAKVDRYGRKVKSTQGKKELARLYQLENAEEESDKSESTSDGDALSSEDESESGSEADDSSDEESEAFGSDSEHIKTAKPEELERKYDPARDGGFSESEEDDSSDSEEPESEVETQAEGAPLEEIDESEVSNRIAVVNLDWDYIRSTDIMAVAASFLPPGGSVKNVAVYPSEFGKERMEHEEVQGPPKELFKKKKKRKAASDSDSDSDSDQEKDGSGESPGGEFDPSTLRKYQLERLRYYYAVITLSSPETAKIIYDSMDGREYLSSANFFDLRFIPEDVTFDNEPRDVCEKLPAEYKPKEFVTHALRHSRVQLSWDADESGRQEVMRKAFDRAGEIDNDLQAYLASGTSDEGEDSDEGKADARSRHRHLLGLDAGSSDAEGEGTGGTGKNSKEDKAAALRAALGLGPAGGSEKGKEKEKDKKPAGNMEITFVPALATGTSKDINTKGVFLNEPENESTREKYVRKQRERKARRKQGAHSDADDSDDDNGGAQPTDGPADDLGFNDPFFLNPDKAIQEEMKKAKKAKKQQREKEEQGKKAQKDKEAKQLELLMADEGGAGSKIAHTADINEILKNQKLAHQKGRAKNKKQARKQAEASEAVAADSFDIKQAIDNRFGQMFDDHDFAINPHDSQFVATDGMKALVAERHRKRKADGDGNGDGDAGPKRNKKDDASEQKEDLKKLVDRVKRKAGKGRK